MAKPKLWSGARFKKVQSAIQKSWYSKESAWAIAASIGRKKYWNKKFQQMAIAGKKKK